jgi:hypothetical protein
MKSSKSKALGRPVEPTSTTGIRLWDDNPSTIDLLGFDAVVDPIIAAVRQGDVHPLTVSVQSPWGGGKSTVLELIAEALAKDDRCIVVRSNPWQYDDHADVRGALIADILNGIKDQVHEESVKEQVAGKIKELFGRISLSRLATAVVRGALALHVDPTHVATLPTDLASIFSPKESNDPTTMAGFADSYKSLLQSIPGIDRVVVLVDDLDRCLPDAVTAVLEAIKLFLCTDKMVFVLAADQDMVRDAIAVSLDGDRRGDTFARWYLEKIVQLPVALPRLSQSDAEAYIGLLFLRRSLSPEVFKGLAQHVRERRRAGNAGLLACFDGLDAPAVQEDLRLAAQLAEGLSADRRANPRQIKRFLNAFGVRESVVKARGIEIRPAAMMKMLLLEEMFRTSFGTLAATPAPERVALIGQWEAWAKPSGDGDAPDLPDGISEETRAWAASEPSLTQEKLDRYIDLAASLVRVGIGTVVSDLVMGLVEGLLSDAQSAREAVVESLPDVPEDEQHEAVEILFAHGRRSGSSDAVIRGAAAWASANPNMAPVLASRIESQCWGASLTPGSVVELAGVGNTAFTELVRKARQDQSLSAQVRETATAELEALDGN